MNFQPTNITEYHGYAITDLPNDSTVLNVYVAELSPFAQGELSAMNITSPVVTRSGDREHSCEIRTTNAIECTWRDEYSNNAAPPRVRKGERVVVYNYGDSNTFYWRSPELDQGARRTDVMRWQVSDTMENNAVLTDNNTYFFEMNTRDTKRIRISTSNSDGEQFRYSIDINAGAGMIAITDDNKNTFTIESLKDRVSMSNAQKSAIVLDGRNITISALGSITICSSEENINVVAQQGNISERARQNYSLVTDTGSISETSATDTKHTVGASFTRTVANDAKVSAGGSFTETVSGAYKVSTASSANLSASSTFKISGGGGVSIGTGGGGFDISPSGIGTATLPTFNVKTSSMNIG